MRIEKSRGQQKTRFDAENINGRKWAREIVTPVKEKVALQQIFLGVGVWLAEDRGFEGG